MLNPSSFPNIVSHLQLGLLRLEEIINIIRMNDVVVES